MIFLVAFIHFFFAFAFFVLSRYIEASFFFLVGSCLLILLFPSKNNISLNEEDEEISDFHPGKLQKTLFWIQSIINTNIFFVFGFILYIFSYGMLFLTQPKTAFFLFLSILLCISGGLIFGYLLYFRKNKHNLFSLLLHIQWLLSFFILLGVSIWFLFQKQIYSGEIFIVNFFLTLTLFFINIRFQDFLGENQKEKILPLFLVGLPYIIFFVSSFYIFPTTSVQILIPLFLLLFSLFYFLAGKYIFPIFVSQIQDYAYILGSLSFLYAMYLFFFTPLFLFSVFFIFFGFCFYSFFHFRFGQEISCVFSVILFILLYSKFVLLQLGGWLFYISIFSAFLPAGIFLFLYILKTDFSLYLRQMYLYLAFFTALIFGGILFWFQILPLQPFVGMVYGFFLTLLLFILFFINKYIV